MQKHEGWIPTQVWQWTSEIIHLLDKFFRYLQESFSSFGSDERVSKKLKPLETFFLEANHGQWLDGQQKQEQLTTNHFRKVLSYIELEEFRRDKLPK